MTLDGESEELVPVLAGLPQRSPLSPILFVIYSSTFDSPSKVKAAAYVDDEVARVGGTTQQVSSRLLQCHLDDRLNRASFLNIKCGVPKAELMHIIPFTSGRQIKSADTAGLRLYREQVPPRTQMKILGVRIDNQLSFEAQAAAVPANTRRSAGMRYRITRCKGASLASIHHLIPTATLPTLIWGSEI